MSVFSSLQHLLPRSEAFKLTAEKYLTKLFRGLAGVGDDAKAFNDLVYLDLFPSSTRELREWEQMYGLSSNTDEETRRRLLLAEWQSTGGQSKSYIEGVLHTAGFEVFIHEWWYSVEPYTARDPRDYTEDPLIGSLQCSDDDEVTCGDLEAQCDAFLINEPGYFANLNLNPLAPPPISSDEDTWPYFLYFSGSPTDITVPATVPASQKQDLRRLIQKLKPSQQWCVLVAEYLGPDFILTDFDGFISTGTGDFILLS
jgi:Uncharacterised protein conserved in bacteria (DUF2313)